MITLYRSDDYTFCNVSAYGSIGNSNVRNTKGVCLGFCLGLEPETITDDWSTILANTNYATDYSIGDTKFLDLGTEGKHLMEIVAINEDDRADGNGKAGLTWISKTLLNTSHQMNSSSKTVDGKTSSTAGGWLHSDMRDYLKNTIKPLIPSDVRNAIVEVSKVSSTYGNALVVNGQTTVDDVWIPSHREVGFGNGKESIGAIYSNKFINDASRKKPKQGKNTGWWLRSVYDNSNFTMVSAYGYSNSMDAEITYYCIALGFCTN